MATSSSMLETIVGNAVGTTLGTAALMGIGKLANFLFSEPAKTHSAQALGFIQRFHFQVGDIFTYIVMWVAVFIAWRCWKNKSSNTARKVVGTATLHLHTYGGGRTPDDIRSENIFRWYFLNTIVLTPGPNGNLQQGIASTTLFIVFEPDVEISTLRVASPNIQLPQYEVKEFNQRYAIIAFTGDVPDGTLTVTVGS